MNIIRLAISAILACVLIVGACAAAGPAPTPNYNLPPVRADAIARLAVDGPAAYINNRPAYHGTYVFNGDNVSTGPGTSAILVLNDGGTIQLDENTDPEFINDGVCVLMRIVGGQALIQTKTICAHFLSKQKVPLAGTVNSAVNLRIDDQEAWLTVLEGRIEMTAPRPATLRTNDRYIAASDGTVDIQPLTPADAAAAGAWRQKYFRAAPPQSPQPQPGGMSTAEKVGIGVVGAIILNKIFGGKNEPARQPNAIAGGGPTQATNSGWCCLPNGGGFSSNPTACRGSQGIFYPGATSSNVCPQPSSNAR